MEKCKTCFVIAAGKNASLELAAGAAQFAQETVLIALSEPVVAEGISKVYRLEEADSSVAVYISAIVELLLKNRPELVLIEQSRNGRLLAGAVAAAFNTAVQTDIFDLQFDGGFISRRAGYGGLAVKTERSSQTAVICAGAGLFQAASEIACSKAEEIKANSSIEFIEKKEKLQQRVNLAAARRVVCVGRGIGDAQTLAIARDLAESLDAELGCTRPVAEEDGLMETNRYIGVSGVSIKPELYLALGLSGQVQHTSGITQADKIIAINKDENAGIFKECDFGLVGDLKEVLPKLTELIRENK